MSRDRDVAPLVVRMPADVDRDDEILAGLSARQLGMVAAAGVLLWLAYSATRALLPGVVFAGLALPAAACTAALVWVRRDGVGLDQLVLSALRQRLVPRRLVPTSNPARDAPGWVSAGAGPLPAPLRLPPRAISTSGVIDLDRDGVAVVCACSTVNFTLRSLGEQHALVGAYARWLNSITGPVQVLIRADRLDLAPLIAALEADAPGLPHPALESSARDHARFLAGLAAERDLLRRQVLLVLREPAGAGGRQAAAGRVVRRAQEAAAGLAAAEVTVTVLDGAQATAVLASAADPHGQSRPGGLAPTGAVITGRDTAEEEWPWAG
ncbi:MAG TPA: PrgI family protein [Mycobacteriales bacterium]|nr:PrgI family protein [Mycobacteriales bacterium]